MIDSKEINEIKITTEELLQKMTIVDFKIEINIEKNSIESGVNRVEDIVKLNINLKEPQFLIGQNGQTLFDLQRVLRIILNKKIKKLFYLKLDINDYQKQKIDYLKSLAKSFASEAILLKEKKVLPPMSSYDRRIIHEELSRNQEVTTESYGEGEERRIIINPK